MIHHPQWFVSVLWHLGMVCVGDLTCFRQAKRSEKCPTVPVFPVAMPTTSREIPTGTSQNFQHPCLKVPWYEHSQGVTTLWFSQHLGFNCNFYRIETSSINWDLCPKKNSEQLALVLRICRRFPTPHWAHLWSIRWFIAPRTSRYIYHQPNSVCS